MTNLSTDSLALDFDTSTISDAEVLEFLNVDGKDGKKDVYNTTVPFEMDGDKFLLARVEERHDELSHRTVLFRQVDEQGRVWERDDRMGELPLQDPFITRIGEELIVGGVDAWREIVQNGDTEEEVETKFRTVMYRDGGTNLAEFSLLYEGVIGRKGDRLVELPDGIGVFTRPAWKDKVEVCKLAFTKIDNLSQLNQEAVRKAQEIGVFGKDEWGGVNQVELLANGRIGVIGHVARLKEGKKSYDAMSFIFDPNSGHVSDYQIIAKYSQFPEVEAKTEAYSEVIYIGGRHTTNDGDMIYCGKYDAAAVRGRRRQPIFAAS